MRRILVAIALISIVAIPAFAQATRTWVSGVGDDVNPCSRTAPCKTWAGAISKTASGGIIDALDPGGFGTLTITKPITLEGVGTLASTLASGTQGIVISISSGSGRDVVLRDIQINGAGTTIGTNGINFIAGDSLTVEHCSIQQFSTTGILFQPNSNAKLKIVKSYIYLSTIGVNTVPVGAVTGFTNIWDSTFHKNNNAVRGDANSKTTVRHSDLAGSGGNCVFATAGAFVMLDGNAIDNCGTGIVSDGSTTIVDANDNTITGNGTGVSSTNSGNLCSYNNNRLEGNTTPGIFSPCASAVTQH